MYLKFPMFPMFPKDVPEVPVVPLVPTTVNVVWQNKVLQLPNNIVLGDPDAVSRITA
jgi:hypothetical protein